MPNINLKTAISKVVAYIDSVKDTLGKNVENLLLEETELSEDGKFWLITIGFDREVDPNKERIYYSNPSMINDLGLNRVGDLLPKSKRVIIERVYKVVKVDSQTGKILSMKMYKF
ncbi:MAG: hypothetical protein AAFQ91_21735 [Cyanobacteria bacterium J06621_15]